LIIWIGFEFTIIQTKLIFALFDTKRFAHFLLEFCDFILLALIGVCLKQNLIELIRIMCFQICVIQTVQCHTVSMSGVKSITTRVRNDLPYSCAIFLCFICWNSIILHDFILESGNETLFQRLNLFWMFLCNCLDNAITFINRESSIVQRVHSLLLIQNETLWKFFCLQNLIKSRDAVRKVLSVFEF